MLSVTRGPKHPVFWQHFTKTLPEVSRFPSHVKRLRRIGGRIGGYPAALSVLVTSMECARQSVSSPWLSYWQYKLPTVSVPKSLPPLASTLTSAETSAYVKKLQLGPFKETDGQGLCRANNMLCGEKAVGPVVCVNAFIYRYGGMKCRGNMVAASDAAVSGVFFDQATLYSGNKIVYPKLKNDLAGRTFLPAGLAEAIPFSKDRLSEHYLVLDVPSDSNMAQNMKRTLSFCESASLQGEIRTCHSSIESMVDFAASNLGTNLVVLSPEYISSQSEQATIRANPVTLTGPEQTSMTCHDLMYPYLVYGCHVMTSSQVMEVELEKENERSFRGLAVCHTDTSNWSEEHPAFTALGVKPGESAVCHWLPQNNFVWIHAK